MSNSWKQIWNDLRNALRNEKTIVETEQAAEANEPSTPLTDAVVVAEVKLATEATQLAIPECASDQQQPGSAVESDSVVSDPPILAPETVQSEIAPLPTVPKWRVVLERTFIATVGILLIIRLGWILGAEQLWATWTEPAPPAPDVIATFDGGKITIADLEAHLKLLVPEEYQATIRSPEGLQLLVNEMVMDELVTRWAAARKFDADETFQHTMQHITEDTNLESFGNQLRDRTISVPESEIQTYYDANRSEFGDQTLSAAREQIRQVLVRQKEQQYITEYIDRLKQNASITRNFELLDVPEPTETSLQEYYQATTQSYTTTAQYTVDMLEIPFGNDEAAAQAAANKALLALQSGADFMAIPGQVQEARLITETIILERAWGTAWDVALQKLQPGEYSAVLRASSTWVIVRLLEAQPSRTLAFDEVRQQILAAVRRQQLDEWMQSNASKTLLMLKSKQYSLGQFYTEYQELSPSVQQEFAGSEGMKRLADQLTERLLLVEDTYDRLLQVQNKEILDQTRLNLLLQMLDQEEIDDKIEITDAELRQFYDENPELTVLPPEARIRYIRIGAGTLDDERQAAQVRIDEAYRKLVPGPFQPAADFASIAKEYSEDPETAAAGGELPGWIGETDNPFEPTALHDLHQIVLGLQVNQMSPPFVLEGSYYIVQVIERTQSEPLTFEQMQPLIRDELHRQKHNALGEELRTRLIKAANVVIYWRVVNAYATQFQQPQGN